MKRMVIALLGLFAVGLSASERVWLQLNAEQFYTDETLECRSIRLGERFYLSALLEGERVVQATLSNFPYQWPYEWIYKSIDLSSEERDSVQWFRDQQGRPWLRKWVLNELTLRWVLYQPAQFHTLCAPPLPLKSVAPTKILFQFETDDIDRGIQISYAPWVRVSGDRSDGTPYRSTFRITQKRSSYSSAPDAQVSSGPSFRLKPQVWSGGHP